ncbi:M48 family metallopeptidase [Methylocaldum sp. MU1018]
MPGSFPVPYSIRRSRRAKHLRLVAKPHGVELVVPPTVSEARALAFLHQHRDWAERKLSELRAKTAASRPARHLENGSTLPFQGREVALEVREHAGRRTHIQYDGRFLIFVPANGSEDLRRITRTALFNWTKSWMRGEAGAIVQRHAGRFGLYPRQIRVKRMTSRWGSCGPRNDINLNWLLAFAPPSILEYVIVHELCHIRHRNHSADFWHLVARHLPGYLAERQWLRRNGGDLLGRFE